MLCDVTRGEALLLAFRDRLGDERLRRLLVAPPDVGVGPAAGGIRDVASAAPPGVGGTAAPVGDRATAALRLATGDDLDLGLPAHRAALLAWLRSWGCRHLRRADQRRSSAALARWWRGWSSALPPRDRSLVDLTHRDLARIEPAYAALASLRAARREGRPGGPKVDVTFGDTAAAKALHALRPLAFPPWDEPIRLAFGTARADGTLYRSYLERTADALAGRARRLGIDVDEIPARLGRPAATPARLIDEYLWLRVTRSASP
jgi:hypothetical protein